MGYSQPYEKISRNIYINLSFPLVSFFTPPQQGTNSINNIIITSTMGLSILDLSLRGVNFVFFTIVLGLTGSLINGQKHSNSRVNFAIFAAVFGLVTSSFYGVLAYFIEFLAWPLITTILEGLNFVFTLAAGAAMAAGLRVHSCTNQAYLDRNAITQGSEDRCRKGQASTAFLFFAFGVTIFTTGSAIASLIGGGAFGSSRRRTGGKGGIPTISTA